MRKSDVSPVGENLRSDSVASLELLALDGLTDLGIIMLDKDGVIRGWNRGAEVIKGYSREEIIGRHLSVLYTMEDRETGKPGRILQYAREKGRYEEEEIRVRKDGSRHWAHVLIVALRDKNGRLLGYADITRNVSGRRRQLVELQNMKYALDQSAIVAITDRSGKILYVNDKFVEISQYSREELVGKTHRMVNSGYHSREYMENIWKTILSGKVWRGEIRNRAKDGSYYWVDTTITPLLDEFGTPVQFIAIRTDITKRKELERQKDDFIGIASHELKTPLTSLKGYVQLLRRRIDGLKDPSAALFISKVENQVDKLNGLVQDLLDVTRIDAGKLSYQKTAFDINALAGEVVDTMQYTTEKHRISLKGESAHQVWGDRDRIGQVLVNFLSNAIKYSPQADSIEVSVSSSDGQAQVCVKDYGVGIAPRDRVKVFDRFYRVSGPKEKTFPGLGLGLYICAEIIKRHRGRIWFDSEIGKGSSFCFSLPVRTS